MKDTAIIQPTDIRKPLKGIPKVAVSCFAIDTFTRMLEMVNAEKVSQVILANSVSPIYRANYQGKEICLFLSDVGAPACAVVMEEVYALGVQTVLMFGTCGVLDTTLGDCSIILPTAAVMDEGTSRHYHPEIIEPGRPIPAGETVTDQSYAASLPVCPVNEHYLELFEHILMENGISARKGRVWTTDAFYRETQELMQAMKERGCICVDMECSAAASVAAFRKKGFFEFFYAADNLDAERWEARSVANKASLSSKDKAAFLALELASVLSE